MPAISWTGRRENFYSTVTDEYKQKGTTISQVKAEQNLPLDKQLPLQSFKQIPIKSGKFDFKPSNRQDSVFQESYVNLPND